MRRHLLENRVLREARLKDFEISIYSQRMTARRAV